MYQEERLQAILDYLKENKRMSVEQICSLFGVSRDTARRDLVKLEEQRAITRTRGGAILPVFERDIRSYKDRLKTVSDEKKAIGRMAAAFVQQRDNVILDTSTTVQACAELIDETCTVVTNSIHQAEILSEKESVTIQLLGGRLNKEHQFLYGPSTIEKLNAYQVDKAFVGVVGIHENGLAIAHEEDGYVKRKMIECAREVIVLADHTKFGQRAFYTFADLSLIDVIITDHPPPKSLQKIFDDHNIIVKVAQE